MSKFDSFEELFQAVSKNPRMRVSKTVLKEVISEAGDVPANIRTLLIATRKVHTTLFFEEVIRNNIFSVEELVTLSVTSAPGAVAVIKNINHYSEQITFDTLRTLLTPVPRASNSVDVVRSKKEVVSALCTRAGFFAYARSVDETTRALYETLYGETFEDTAVNYIISVYAQELVLSANDKQVILPRVANSLRRAGEDTHAAKTMEFFIRNRFYHRIFEKKE